MSTGPSIGERLWALVQLVCIVVGIAAGLLALTLAELVLLALVVCSVGTCGN